MRLATSRSAANATSGGEKAKAAACFRIRGPGHWTTPTTALLLLASLFFVASLTALVAFVTSDYRQTLRDTSSQMEVLTELLEEHAHRTIEASDLVLLRTKDLIRDVGIDALRYSRTDWEQLVEIAQTLPQIGSLWVVDASGATVASSLQFEPMPGNFGDQNYFKAHQLGTRGALIGDLTAGHHTNSRFFSVSRPILGPGGVFAGVVLVAVHVDYFERFYKPLGLKPGSAVGIFRSDGTLLVREPWPPEPESVRASPDELGVTEERRLSTKVAVSPIDGLERIAARRLVERYPLIVAASMPTSAAFAGWRERLHSNAILVAVAWVAVGALTALGLRGLNREALMRSALHDVNAGLEQRVVERTAELQSVNQRLRSTLEERNLLLREVYHRVKNNLQLIEALMAMQSRQLESQPAREAFLATRRRIAALGLVHQQLLEARDLATFNLRDFLTDLTRNIAQGAGAEARGIAVKLDVEPLPADLDFAIPLGLLLNELVSNAFKHAFPDRTHGNVEVVLHRREESIALIVADDGLGMAVSEEQEAAGSTGSRIIRALLSQLKATASVLVNSGTRIEIVMPFPELLHGQHA